MKTFVVGAATFAAIVLNAGATELNADQQLLVGLEQTWVKAVSEGDRTTMRQLLDDCYVETTAKGQTRLKSDVLVAPPPPPLSMQRIESIDVEVRGDTAVVRGTNRYRSAPSMQPVNYRFVDQFVRRNGSWYAVRSQMTRESQ
jgi:hypothetical protein